MVPGGPTRVRSGSEQPTWAEKYCKVRMIPPLRYAAQAHDDALLPLTGKAQDA